MFPCHQGELGSGRLGVRTPAPGVANQAACVGVEKQQSLVLPSVGKGWKGREEAAARRLGCGSEQGKCLALRSQPSTVPERRGRQPALRGLASWVWGLLPIKRGKQSLFLS